MVDSNLHREHILPSEKAKAYKMKMDAMKRQGERTDLTLSPMSTKSVIDSAAEIGSAASKVVRKTEEIADITVKRVKLASSEAKTEKLYEKLGRLTYKQLKTGETQAEKISEVILEIDRSRAESAELRREIEADKKAARTQKSRKSRQR